MSSLASNVHLMTNRELNGLAQNRFIDKATQLALANHHYRLCREYLSLNSALHPEARDILWNRRGFVLKANLVKQGHYKNEPEKYRELYNLASPRWKRGGSAWRMSSCFLKSYWHDQEGYTNTPSDVLDSIYEDFLKTNSGNPYTSHHSLIALANHPNLGLKLALKLSSSDKVNSGVTNAAFRRLATFSDQNKVG